jgi:flagellar biosynthetic protein FliQ
VTVEEAVWLGQQALLTALVVSGPLLLTALVVGSAVSILQTVLQVQEATLAFVPKMIAVFVVLSLLGGFMLGRTVDFGTEIFLSIGADR